MDKQVPTQQLQPRTSAGQRSAIARFGSWFYYALCLLLIATALLPLLLHVDIWWIRAGDFPRVQLLVCYLLALPGLVLLRKSWPAKLCIAGLVAGIGIQLFWIFPYLPIAPLEVQPAQASNSEQRVRILTANVLQDNRNAEDLLALIRQEDPDLVVLCEVDDWWISHLAQLEQDYPFQLKHPLNNTYGLALYTRLDVSDAQVRHMVVDSIPSIDARLKLKCGHEVRLFAVHPNPPRPAEDTTKRDAELVLVGREVRDERSAIVLGDLNDVGWSRTTDLFQEVSGLLDPRKGRGMYSTFNAKSSIWRYPLDYLFHSDDFRIVEMRVLPGIGSDHFPLLVELSHEPDAAASQEGPQMDAGDQEDAQQAVDKVK